MFKSYLIGFLILATSISFAKSDIVNDSNFQVELFSSVNNFMVLKYHKKYIIVFDRFGRQNAITCNLDYENCRDLKNQKISIDIDVIDSLSKHVKVYFSDKPYTMLYQGTVVNVL